MLSNAKVFTGDARNLMTTHSSNLVTVSVSFCIFANMLQGSHIEICESKWVWGVEWSIIDILWHCTGKSFSEALILASVNPQYGKRLFIDSPEKYKFRTCCVQILFWMSKQKQKNNFCTQHVVNLYFSWNLMNNISSYCGLTDSRMRASEKDIPVIWSQE